MGAEQLPLELGELAVRRKCSPRTSAIAKNPSRVTHHGHSDERYRLEVRTTRASGYSVSVLRPLAIASVLLVAVLAGCGGSSTTKDDFRQDVLTARNHTDAGLAQIVNARSLDDLLDRMRIAASEVRSAAHDLEEAGAPKDLQDERDALAARLLALSDEIASTVETLESFPDQAAATKALSFEQWNSVQAELQKLRAQGVDVRPLERHKPEPQRQ
jgi:hypothetical protein